LLNFIQDSISTAGNTTLLHAGITAWWHTPIPS